MPVVTLHFAESKATITSGLKMLSTDRKPSETIPVPKAQAHTHTHTHTRMYTQSTCTQAYMHTHTHTHTLYYFQYHDTSCKTFTTPLKPQQQPLTLPSLIQPENIIYQYQLRNQKKGSINENIITSATENKQETKG